MLVPFVESASELLLMGIVRGLLSFIQPKLHVQLGIILQIGQILVEARSLARVLRLDMTAQA